MEYSTGVSESGEQFFVDALIRTGPGEPLTRQFSLSVADQSSSGQPEIVISIRENAGVEPAASFLCNHAELKELVEWLRHRKIVK